MRLNTVSKSLHREEGLLSPIKEIKKKKTTTENKAIKAFSLLKFTHCVFTEKQWQNLFPCQHSRPLLGAEIHIRKLGPITHLHVT